MFDKILNSTVGDVEGMSREDIEQVVERIKKRQHRQAVTAIDASVFWDDVRSSRVE